MYLLPSFTSLAVIAITAVSGYTPLSDASLAALPSPGNDFDIHNGAILAPILRVRIPGTPEIEEVRQHFVNFFEKSLPKWTIGYQNSTQPTALNRDIFFSNLVISRDPPWAKPGDVGRLTLVAHYDSKITPKGFIGATDSAAPCAMILHAARSIDDALTQKWAEMEKNGDHHLSDAQGVQIFLLDGEEAFVEWTDKDSIYGARSLADQLDGHHNPAMSTYRTGLSEISLFVLLDLLGTAGPNLPSYFRTTHWAYQKMATIEKRLRGMHEFRSSPNYAAKGKGNFRPVADGMWLSEVDKPVNAYWAGGMVEDDHIPFFQKGVEVLHVIPGPFPWVWHTPDDDGEHLDIPTVQDWAQLTTAFAAEWLELEGFMPKAVKARSEDKSEL
jgi:glutaminyl-peptide cyclotransferase